MIKDRKVAIFRYKCTEYILFNGSYFGHYFIN